MAGPLALLGLAGMLWPAGGAARAGRLLGSFSLGYGRVGRGRPKFIRRLPVAVLAAAATTGLAVAVRPDVTGLLAGGVLGTIGYLLARRYGPARRGPARRGPGRRALDAQLREVPGLLDLVAMVLRSGAPMAAALELVAGAVACGPSGIDADGPGHGPRPDSQRVHGRRPDSRQGHGRRSVSRDHCALMLAGQLHHVASLASLGATPAAAWSDYRSDPVWCDVARSAELSAESGSAMADTLDRLASQHRARGALRARSAAQRVSVLAMAPLGLCFLPAFICIGVIPVVLGLLSGLAGVLG